MSANSVIGFGNVTLHKKGYINTRNIKGAQPTGLLTVVVLLVGSRPHLEEVQYSTRPL